MPLPSKLFQSIGEALRTAREHLWLRLRRCSGVAGCFLNQLYVGAQAEFGVDVGEVGLHGAR
jgi:hypothetical protein